MDYPNMISKKTLSNFILFLFLFIIITSIEVAANSLINATDAEKKELLEWVNDHCGKEYDSFDSLLKDRRIKCKCKKDEVVPPSYYLLDGSRHVIPYSAGIDPVFWFPIPFFAMLYLFIVFINYKKKRKMNHLKYSISLLIIALPWLIGVYAISIYQGQFLKSNVNFIRMHGHGKFNSFLLQLCCSDLFFLNSSWVYAAVDTGSLDMVKFLVEEMKVDPNKMYKNVLPLALAANHKMTDITDYLFKFAPETPEKGGEFLLKTAILTGRLDYVKRVFEHDSMKKLLNDQHPGATWISRRSALYLAVYRNDIDIATFLLENGADPNISNEYDGKTPIDAAVQNKNVEMQKLLKKYGK